MPGWTKGEDSRSQPIGGAPSELRGGEGEPSGLTLTETLDAIREAMRPVFDEQRETWEREGPSAMAALAATGATLDQIGGNCPVQAEGGVDGQRFYFRARGGDWQFHVALTDDLIFDAPTFYIEREYGEWPDAGWMPNHEAIGLIVQAIGEFRAQASQARGEPGDKP